MKNEHKDALTGLCKVEIKRWKVASESNPNMRYMVELMEVALAALTAQPVKLPDPYGMQDHERWLKQSEVESAIRAAGYEVQE